MMPSACAAAMPLALAASLVAAAVFAYQSSGQSRGGNPAFAVMSAAQNAPIAQLAPVLGLDAATALQRLANAGYGTVAPDDSVTAVAERNQVEPFAVMATLTAKVS